jgi:spectinomycin phosphotransferase
VRSALQLVEEDVIRQAVIDGWGLRIDGLRPFPHGGGAFHWTTDTDDGRRWFVTCDDLETKPWLGPDRETVFAGLLSAYGTAMDLRRAGLAFVVAPLATVSGASAERIDDRHSVSVFEHVDGEPGEWGRPMGPATRRQLVEALADLHRAAPSGRAIGRRGLEVPGRGELERALDELGQRWEGGPLSDEARHELTTHAGGVVRWLDELDRVAAELDPAPEVLTHGEPHPGNLISTPGGVRLVDWDTMAVARPERDLWMLDGDDVAASRVLTGIEPDPAAMAAYRLLWALSDVAAFTVRLRGGHHGDADDAAALAGLRSVLDGREPAPYGVPPRLPR